MNRTVSSTIALVAISILTFGSLSPASATTETLSPAAQKQAQALVAESPELTESALVNDVEVYSASTGVSVESVLRQASSESAQSIEATSSSKKGKRTKKIGNAKHKGDVFVTPAFTGGVNHGHTGIYSAKPTIVEAPGTGKKSRSTSASSYKVPKKSYKMDVKISQTKRNKAGSYAYNKLRGKKYSANFAVNKKTGSAKMNCSQLVWAAYKASVKIDLDGNGGLGVYPYNIKDSKHTHIYKTIK